MRSATHWTHRHLVRELALVLALKLLVITALWWGFVHERQVPVDGTAAAALMLGTADRSATKGE